DQLLHFRRCVLDDVVQDRRNDGLCIDVQIREDVGGGDRVRDVGLTRKALLALVSRRPEFISLLDALHLLGRQVVLQLGNELIDAEGAPSARQETQDGGGVIHGGSRLEFRHRVPFCGRKGRSSKPKRTGQPSGLAPLYLRISGRRRAAGV